jgi:diketogulonate reductase-like aldo/keto reductase
MKTITLPDGTAVPALGQGTWMLAEDHARRAEEIAALREGIARAMTLIDTAEMYGEGAAETLVGEAIAGQRDEVFLVSKAYPQNASARRLRTTCEASLKRREPIASISICSTGAAMCRWAKPSRRWKDWSRPV